MRAPLPLLPLLLLAAVAGSSESDPTAGGRLPGSGGSDGPADAARARAKLEGALGALRQTNTHPGPEMVGDTLSREEIGALLGWGSHRGHELAELVRQVLPVVREWAPWKDAAAAAIPRLWRAWRPMLAGGLRRTWRAWSGEGS